MDYPVARAASRPSLLLRVTTESLVASCLCLFFAFGILLINQRLLEPMVGPLTSMQRAVLLCGAPQFWWLVPYLWLSFLAIELMHRNGR